MKISIGCDHSALELKDAIITHLESLGHVVLDKGTYTKDSCDYTDYGYLVAKDIKDGVVERGIVICYTGIGMSIIANKVKGVRCALVGSKDAATLTREHNDTNCLALSAKYTGFSFEKNKKSPSCINPKASLFNSPYDINVPFPSSPKEIEFRSREINPTLLTLSNNN